MSTPDKRVTGHSHNSYVDTSANSNCKSFIQNCYSTPTIDKRKLRKRKLFDAGKIILISIYLNHLLSIT